MQRSRIVRVGHRDQITIVQSLNELFLLPFLCRFLVVPPERLRVFTKAFFEKFELSSLSRMKVFMNSIHDFSGLLYEGKRSPDRSLLLSFTYGYIGSPTNTLPDFLDMGNEGNKGRTHILVRKRHYIVLNFPSTNIQRYAAARRNPKLICKLPPQLFRIDKSREVGEHSYIYEFTPSCGKSIRRIAQDMN